VTAVFLSKKSTLHLQPSIIKIALQQLSHGEEAKPTAIQFPEQHHLPTCCIIFNRSFVSWQRQQLHYQQKATRSSEQ
jgi:hypothetical protein